MYLVIFVFTAGVNQYYGYDGYMPLDQSMIYNGAWRLLSGQTPYVDFWTPYGTIPILVQAGISGPSAFLGQTMFFRLL